MGELHEGPNPPRSANFDEECDAIFKILEPDELSPDLALQALCALFQKVRAHALGSEQHAQLQKILTRLQDFSAVLHTPEFIESIAAAYDNLLKADYSRTVVLSTILQLLFLIEDISEHAEGKVLCGTIFVGRLISLVCARVRSLRLERAAAETLCALITRSPENQEIFVANKAGCKRLFTVSLSTCGDFHMQATISEMLYRLSRRHPELLEYIDDAAAKRAMSSISLMKKPHVITEIRKFVTLVNASMGASKRVHSFKAEKIVINGREVQSQDKNWVHIGANQISLYASLENADNEAALQTSAGEAELLDIYFRNIKELNRRRPSLLEISFCKTDDVAFVSIKYKLELYLIFKDVAVFYNVVASKVPTLDNPTVQARTKSSIGIFVPSRTQEHDPSTNRRPDRCADRDKLKADMQDEQLPTDNVRLSDEPADPRMHQANTSFGTEHQQVLDELNQPNGLCELRNAANVDHAADANQDGSTSRTTKDSQVRLQSKCDEVCFTKPPKSGRDALRNKLKDVLASVQRESGTSSVADGEPGKKPVISGASPGEKATDETGLETNQKKSNQEAPATVVILEDLTAHLSGLNEPSETDALDPATNAHPLQNEKEPEKQTEDSDDGRLHLEVRSRKSARKSALEETPENVHQELKKKRSAIIDDSEDDQLRDQLKGISRSEKRRKIAAATIIKVKTEEEHMPVILDDSDDDQLRFELRSISRSENRRTSGLSSDALRNVKIEGGALEGRMLSHEDDESLLALFARLLQKFNQKLQTRVQAKTDCILNSAAEKIKSEAKATEVRIQADLDDFVHQSQQTFGNVERRVHEEASKFKRKYDEFCVEFEKHARFLDDVMVEADSAEANIVALADKQKAAHRRLILQTQKASEEHLADVERKIQTVRKAAAKHSRSVRELLQQFMVDEQ